MNNLQQETLRKYIFQKEEIFVVIGLETLPAVQKLLALPYKGIPRGKSEIFCTLRDGSVRLHKTSVFQRILQFTENSTEDLY